MAFTYTSPPITQSISGLVLVGLAVGVFYWPAAQSAWAQLVETVPEGLLVAGGPYLVFQVVYWGMCAAFGYVDRTQRPRFIARYRIQSGKSHRPPWSRVWRNLALTQLVLSPIMMAWLWGMLHLRGWQLSATLPDWQTTLLELLGLSLALRRPAEGACVALAAHLLFWSTGAGTSAGGTCRLALCDDTAPSASLDHLEALAAPTHLRSEA